MRLALAAIAASFFAGISAAENVVISSGQVGGHYDSVAHRMQVVINSELGSESFVEIHNSQGSIENLIRLGDPDSPVNVAFTQADALSFYLGEHPDFEEAYTILTDLGKECVFLLTAKSGGITHASDLHAGGEKEVAVGAALSGSALTYRNIQRIDPRFAATRARNGEVVAALLALKSRKPHDKLAAALVVQRPLAISAPIEIVLENQDLYRIVPIRPDDVKGATESERGSGYFFRTVSVGVGRDYSAKFETMCTEGLILASKKKTSPRHLEELTGTVLRNRSYLVPGKRLR